MDAIPNDVPPWPPEFLHVQDILRHLRLNNPRFEESWYGYIGLILSVAYPSALPEAYFVKPQYNLRLPLEEDDPRASFDSQHRPVLGRNYGKEPGIKKPDFFVVRGPHGHQHAVLLVEVKKENAIDQDGADRFLEYCHRMLVFGDSALHVAVMLIAGGIVYTWHRDELQELVDSGPLDNQRLAVLENQPGRCVQVDSDAFMWRLENIRDRFAETDVMIPFQ